MTASIVQTGAVTLSANASSIGPSSISTTAGHALLLAVVMRNPPTDVSGVTDSAGNAWALILRETITSGSSMEVWGTTGTNPGAVTSITASLNFSDTVVCRWFEIAGGNNAALIDKSAGADLVSGTAIASGASGTLTATNELALGIIGFVAVRNLTGTPAFTQGTESTSYPSSSGIDSSTGTSQANIHCGTLAITTTTGQGYSGTINSASAWSAITLVLASAPPIPPMADTITRPGVRWVRTRADITGGAPLTGQNTFRAQLLNARTGVEQAVQARGTVRRTVAPLPATAPQMFRVGVRRPPVQQTVSSHGTVARGPALAGIRPFLPRGTIVRPSVIAFRKATARITRGLVVAQGQNTLRARPTVVRPIIQFVRTKTVALLQPFGPIAPPFVPPSGADGWGDDWDKWNILNAAEPNFGDGWE